MRNLKKILALVLALVMSLSLMATAGASSFSDVDDSNPYSTAIDVLDALKVFIGYEDGSFQPTGELTRAEAAVLVYRIATGDVEGKYVENYTYMANSKFNDLDNGYGWAKGYINYCQNAEIIKGTSATTFSPGLKVTGYQLMVMVLRTLGYDKAGEFSDPITWELESARKCEQLGMLKNIPNTGDFGNAAPRAMTAEILFRGLLQNTVKYSVMTPGGYTMDATTLGYQKFTLEEVTGVVVANEYADIRRDENLKGTDKTAPDGITVLDVNGEEYNIVVTSKLEDLGETRTTYTVENGQRDGHNLTGIALENLEADRIVYDDGEALTTTAFSSTLGNVDKDAQRYLNFGENGGVDKTTIKVTYQAESIIEQRSARTADEAKDDFIEKYHLDKATAGQNVDAEYVNHLGSGVYKVTYTPKTTDLLENKEQVLNTGDGHVYSIVKEYAIGSETPTPRYRVEIEPGYTYTAFDKAMVTSIFARASWTVGGTAAGLIVKGEVFRGTQIATDYSDRNNYDVFEDNCLKLAEEHVNTSIDSNSLGWWLKVIDNDNDGYTDWVFQTRYTVAKVSAVNEETGKLTLDTTDWLTEEHKYIEGWDNKNTGWDAADAVNNKGRNITAIDYDEAGLAVGDVVYYAAIDGKNYAWKCDVVTDRVESINRSARTVTLTNKDLYHESAVHEHSASIDLYSFVANMSGTVGMNLYLDKYGNLAAFSQNISGNFVLLTDGWAQTQKNGTDYAVVTWNSTDKKLEQHDVSEGGNLFVRGTGDNTGDGWSVNSWNRIQYFNPLNCDVVDGKLTNDYVHTMVAYMEENGDTVRLLPVDAVYDVQRLNGREYRMIDMNKTVPTNVLPRGTTNGEIWATTTLNGWPYNAKATPTATDPNPTRVRALNNTTYLFVYQSQDRVSVENGWWQNNNASGLYVHQEDGYANGTAWAKGLDNWIEDVYVVGERAEDVDGVFYTANVVVVELKEGFSPNTHKDLEQAFIYNIPTTIGLNTVEQVDAILGSTGEDADILVDLGDARNYTEAESTNNVILPGLYWLHRTGKTSADGKDIYYVEHMHHDDVAANSYYVGTVRSSDFVSSADYVDIYDWYCNNSGVTNGVVNAANGTHHNESSAAHAVSAANPWQGSLSALTPKNVESSKYYNLSYDASKWGTATPSSAGVTLSQWKDWGTVSNKNLNQVLVRYNGAGNIVYAVSFDHLLGNTLNENYAQYVWRTCLKDGYTAPAQQIGAATVEFFGVTDGHDDDQDNTANNKAITVTYNKASTFSTTADNIVVKGDKITSVTLDGVPFTKFNTAKTEWSAKVPVAAGTHKVGIVQDGKYTEWNLTQNAQVTNFGNLISKDENLVQISNGGTAPLYASTELKFRDAEKTTVKTLEELLTTTLGAKVTVKTMRDIGGNPVVSDNCNGVSSFDLELSLNDATYPIKNVTVNNTAISGTYRTVTLPEGAEAYLTLADVAAKKPIPVKTTAAGVRQISVLDNTALWFTHAGDGVFGGVGGGNFNNDPTTPAWIGTEGYTLWGQSGISADTNVTFTAFAKEDASITGATLNDNVKKMYGAKIENLNVTDSKAATMDLTLPKGTTMSDPKFSDYRYFDLETWFGIGNNFATGLTGSRPMKTSSDTGWNINSLGEEVITVSNGTAPTGYTAQFIVTVKGNHGGSDATLTVNVKERDTASYYLYLQGGYGAGDARTESGNVNIAFYDVGKQAWVTTTGNELQNLAAGADLKLTVDGTKTVALTDKTQVVSGQYSPRPSDRQGDMADMEKFNMAPSQFDAPVVATYFNMVKESGTVTVAVASDVIDIVNFSTALNYDFPN